MCAIGGCLDFPRCWCADFQRVLYPVRGYFLYQVVPDLEGYVSREERPAQAVPSAPDQFVHRRLDPVDLHVHLPDHWHL